MNFVRQLNQLEKRIAQLNTFNEKRIAQAAAYLLHKNGGSMHHQDLMRMLYMADKIMYMIKGRSMTFDEPVSTEHGPMLLATLKIMKGKKKSKCWNTLISSIRDNIVTLLINIDPMSFDGISAFDMEILDKAYKSHTKRKQWNLINIAKEFPEWDKTTNKIKPIELKKIMKSIGENSKSILVLTKKEQEWFNRSFNSYRELKRDKYGWVKVSDALPMCNDRVIVYGYFTVPVSEYLAGTFTTIDRIVCGEWEKTKKDKKVTHWQRFPELPEDHEEIKKKRGLK